MHSVADVSLDFVEKLGSVTPRVHGSEPGEHLTYVKAFSSASEAMEAAIKFTRQYHKQAGNPNKYKFVSRYMAYHGATLGATSASGTGARRSPAEPLAPGFFKVFPPNHYRDRLPEGTSWEEVNRFAAQAFEDTIIGEDPTTVAGVIVEPIGNTGGIITPTDEYFHIIRDVCDRHKVILIFDETITGFGRTGNMFGAQTFGVVPDVIVCGKGLSSGVIGLAAMVAKQHMASVFQQDLVAGAHVPRFFAHGQTYSNSPVACAVGLAVIDEIERQGLCRRACELGTTFRVHLEKLKRFNVVREIRGRGLLLGVELVKDASVPASKMCPFPELGMALKKTALKNGLILRIDPSWFAVGPALTSTESEVAEMARLIEKSLEEALHHVTTSPSATP